jgi:hypothetical protein
MKLRLNFSTTPFWWDTVDNWEADGLTRVERDNDWRLGREHFLDLWASAGPFSMDLMASSISRHCCPKGQGLPFFSRFFSHGCKGVDLLAQNIPPGTYFCFPHHRMVKAVVNHLASFQHIRVILIARRGDTSWLPRVRGSVERQFRMAKGAVTTADLSATPEHIMFGCWILNFV